MARAWIAFAVMCVLAAGAAADQTRSYGWESCQTPMGTYNEPEWQIGRGQVHTGTCALEGQDLGGGTPQVYVAWIRGLTDGDVVSASLWTYDDTPGTSPSCRIWAHWNDDPDDVTGFDGSAAGNPDYGAGIGWEELSWSWTVEEGHTGLVIEARLYGSPGQIIPIDEITVTAPDPAWIQMPAPCVDFGVEDVIIEYEGDYIYVWAEIDCHVYGDVYGGVTANVAVSFDGVQVTDVPWFIDQIPWDSCYFDDPAGGCHGSCPDREVNGQMTSGTCVTYHPVSDNLGPRCACRYRVLYRLTDAILYAGQQMAQVLIDNGASRDDPCLFELNLDDNYGETEVIPPSLVETLDETVTWTVIKGLYR